MIVYDTATRPLVYSVHRLSGIVRTGKSQAVKNYTTSLQIHGQRESAELALTDIVSEISGLSGKLAIDVPEVYEFVLGAGEFARELAAVHGIITRKMKYATHYEYRFIVCFRDETFKTLRHEFGMSESKWRKLITERLTA